MALPLSAKEFELGKELLAKHLKKVDIEVEGNKVRLIQHFELPTPEVARSFAENLKEMFSG